MRQDSFVIHSKYRTDHGLTKKQFDDRFSDHYLVSFEIELVADDD